MSELFFYKLVGDTNGAPCVDNGLLTLAICKPMIRSVAKRGDWILDSPLIRYIKIIGLSISLV
jgi:hypothetical protein